jgi:hypothetical protein
MAEYCGGTLIRIQCIRASQVLKESIIRRVDIGTWRVRMVTLNGTRWLFRCSDLTKIVCNDLYFLPHVTIKQVLFLRVC